MMPLLVNIKNISNIKFILQILLIISHFGSVNLKITFKQLYVFSYMYFTHNYCANLSIHSNYSLNLNYYSIGYLNLILFIV